MFGEQTVVRLMARLCLLHTDPPVHDAQLPTCGNIVVDHQADLCRELVNLTEAWWREYMSQQQLCHKDGSLWCEFVLLWFAVSSHQQKIEAQCTSSSQMISKRVLFFFQSGALFLAICYILEQTSVICWNLELKFAICTVHRFFHGVHWFTHSFHRFFHRLHWICHGFDLFFHGFNRFFHA